MGLSQKLYLCSDPLLLRLSCPPPPRLHQPPACVILAALLDQLGQGILLLPQGLRLLGNALCRTLKFLNSRPDICLLHRLHFGKVVQLRQFIHLPAAIQRCVSTDSGQ